MVDAGLLVGAAALGLALVSLVYARTQADASHRQAEAETRAAMLASNLAMYERLKEVRRRFVEPGPLYEEWVQSNPRVKAAYDEAGGVDAYYTIRETMDFFQDIYFLRQGGVISDHYWHVWSGTVFRNYGKMPTFRRVFEFASGQGYLHPDFVAFYQAVLAGRPGPDPVARAAAGRRAPGPA